MKKILISALLAAITLTSASCSYDKDDNSSEKTSTESSAKTISPESAAKKMADDLTTLTNDNVFINLLGMPKLNDVLKEFQGAKTDTDTIYSLELKYDDLANLFHADRADLKGISAPAKAKIMENIANTFTHQMSEYENTSKTNLIAVLSMLNYRATFSGLTDVSDQIWFMPTDKEGISVCVSFIETSENVTTATASYFCYENDSDLENSINSCIKKAGISTTVKER